MKTAENWEAKIFIAGDMHALRHSCRKFCERGLCVTATPTEYIFTGGSENGAIIGLISYARFPKHPLDLEVLTFDLARQLMADASQRSCTVLTQGASFYLENENISVPQ